MRGVMFSSLLHYNYDALPIVVAGIESGILYYFKYKNHVQAAAISMSFDPHFFFRDNVNVREFGSKLNTIVWRMRGPRTGGFPSQLLAMKM